MNSIIGTPALSASHPRLPLLQGFVPAGFPSPAADYVQNTIDLHERLIHNPEATFFIRVSGPTEELQIFGVVTSHIVEHVTLTRPRR